MNDRASSSQLRPSALDDESAQWADQACEWLRWFANKRLNTRLMDERRMLSPLPVLEFGNKGLMAMEVAPAFGGLGWPASAALRVFEQLGAIDLTLATFLINNNCLGIRPFERHAKPDKKSTVLPALASGREMISFALSEPGAGSNPMALATQARACEGGWALRGQKMWIGNAAWANHLNVFCRLDEEGAASSGLTAFCLDPEQPGVSMGGELLTMGMRGMVQNTIHLDDARVSQEDMLGRAGDGMAVANDAMMHTRLAFGAAFMGAMRRAVQIAAGYAAKRQVGTGLLLEHPETAGKLAHADARIDLIDALLTVTREAAVPGGLPMTDDFYVVCKVASSEFLWRVVDDAIQVCGGRGYLENNVLPRFLRDARVSRIYEGPTETLIHYMGQRVLKGSPALTRDLAQRCACPDLAQLLDEVAGKLTARKAVLAHQTTPQTAHAWVASEMGWIALWTILLAAYRCVHGDGQGEVSRWANEQLDQRLIAALDDGRGPVTAMGEAHWRRSLDRHGQRVGRVAEALPGEADALDALMGGGT